MADIPELLTVAEAAERLRCRPRTVWRLIASGALDRRRIGKRTCVTAESVIRYLRGPEENAGSPRPPAKGE